MSDKNENKELSNHQILESCAADIFRKINRKKIIRDNSDQRGKLADLKNIL